MDEMIAWRVAVFVIACFAGVVLVNELVQWCLRVPG
jgi:hypothetical protein